MEKTDRERTVDYLRQFFTISKSQLNMVTNVREYYGSRATEKEIMLMEIHDESLKFINGTECTRLTHSEFYAVIDGLLSKIHLLSTQMQEV